MFNQQGQLDARDLADMQAISVTEGVHRSLRLNKVLVDWQREGGEIVLRRNNREWPLALVEPTSDEPIIAKRRRRR